MKVSISKTFDPLNYGFTADELADLTDEELLICLKEIWDEIFEMPNGSTWEVER